MMVLHYKAQLYCIGILLVLLFMCIWGIKKKEKESGLFIVLLFFSIINMCFDIASNYTVNHLDAVSELTNRIVHIWFFISLTTIFMILYKFLENIIEKECGNELNYKITTFVSLSRTLKIQTGECL